MGLPPARLHPESITLGSRQAVDFRPMPGVEETELAEAAQLASIADDTPEGRSVVVLATVNYNLCAPPFTGHAAAFVPFSAYTGLSGVDVEGRVLRKGDVDAIARFVVEQGGLVPSIFEHTAETIALMGGTPLGVADGLRLLGIIHLKDVGKGDWTLRLHSVAGGRARGLVARVFIRPPID